MNCANCGIEFQGRKRKHCSPECRMEFDKRNKEQARRSRRLPRKCLFCGVEFVPPKSDQQKLCSTYCRNKYYSKLQSLTMTDKQCSVCGRSLNKWQGKYCSRECMHTDQQREGEHARELKWYRVCKMCGKEFIMSFPSGKAKRGEIKAGLFCSRVCRWDWMKGQPKLSHHKNSCKVYFNQCNICKMKFTSRYQSSVCDSVLCRKEYARKQSRTLSIKNHKPKLVICKECGKTFYPAYSNKHRKFCSDECSLRFDRRVHKGIRRARVRGVQYESVNKKLVYERDHKRCQACGVKVKFYRDVCHPGYAQLDHIIPLARGGAHTYNNVQILCRACNLKKADGYLRDQLRLC